LPSNRKLIITSSVREQAPEPRVRRPAPQEPIEEVVRQLRNREERRDDQRPTSKIDPTSKQPSAVVPQHPSGSWKTMRELAM
jgi:hypothetical protein